MISRWFRRLLIALVVAFILFYIGIWLIFAWPEIQFQVAIRTYPSAKQIGDSSSSCSHALSTCFNRLYHWTEDPLSQVEAFYETFAPTFVRKGMPIQYYASLYHPFGGELVASNEVGHTVDVVSQRECYYLQRYECISVQLVDLTQSQQLSVELISSEIIEQLSSSSRLSHGTMIIQIYYTYDL